jgi:hypothetical protein
MAALGVALVLALYSGAAAELNRRGLSIISAIAALIVAGWVAVTLVPVLAKRTPLRWLGYRIEYKVTKEGWIYVGSIEHRKQSAVSDSRQSHRHHIDVRDSFFDQFDWTDYAARAAPAYFRGPVSSRAYRARE